MKLNKKYFLGLFAAIGMQLTLGVDLAIAGPCDDYIKREYSLNNEINSVSYSSLNEYGNEKYRHLEHSIFIQKGMDGKFRDAGGAYPTCSAFVKSRVEIMVRDKYTDNSYYCFHKIASDNNCNNLNGFKFGGDGLSAYKFSGEDSNKSTNQTPSSGTSSNQTNSPQPTAQLENTQTNTNQQATKSKKGKKNPNDVTAKCVNFNYDKTKIVNMCSFPINITYCNMHQDDQSIQVTNSCNDGFVTETIYPGRAISDESLNTRLFSTACKHPSVSQNNKYIAFDTPPNGTCSK